jgi:hypothetical protein
MDTENTEKNINTESTEKSAAVFDFEGLYEEYREFVRENVWIFASGGTQSAQSLAQRTQRKARDDTGL